jgi:hypothetical protein
MKSCSLLSVSAPIALALALVGINAGRTARVAEIKLLCGQPTMSGPGGMLVQGWASR